MFAVGDDAGAAGDLRLGNEMTGAQRKSRNPTGPGIIPIGDHHIHRMGV